MVFLPLHVVRAVGRDGRVEHLVYSQVRDDADDDLAPLVASSPAPGLLDQELEDGRAGQDEKRAREWLDKRGLSRWQPITKVGSYVMLGTGFLRLWCSSDEVRQRTLLERINAYLGYRAQAAGADVQEQVDRIARQLDLGTINLATLSRRAKEAGNRGLAAQLARLSSSTTKGG